MSKAIKKIIISSLLILSFGSTYACDICGCGVGNYYVGLLPEFNKRFAGVRYQYSSIRTQLDIQGNRTALTSDEKYHSTELWGAWNIGSRWRVMAIIPYSFNEKYNEGSDLLRKKNGLSDIVINANYKLFEGMKTNSKDNLLIHSLWLGAGVKFATGQYDVQEQNNNSGINPNIFQLGTGSTDLIANIIYDIRLQDLGLNLNNSYRFNSRNKDKYRYGNKFSSNLLAYYKISLGENKRLAPNIGLNYETQAKDHTMGFRVDETGGNILNGIIGLEANINRLSIGANIQNPLKQDLGQGRIEANHKIFTHISFAF